MANQKPRDGKKKGPTRKKPKEGKTAVLAEFKDFKWMFHRWADKIQLDWNDHVPFSPGSEYRFILPNEMVNFVVSLVKRSHTHIDAEELVSPADKEAAEAAQLEATQQLSEAIESGVQERLDPKVDVDPEPEAKRNDHGVLDKRTSHDTFKEKV